MKLLWVDIESTGLDVERDEILAVGAVLTGPDLKPVGARFELHAHITDPALLTCDDYVRQMHTQSGLFARCQAAHLYADEVLERFESWARKGIGEYAPVYLAGSSVHFDRKFIESYDSKLFKRLGVSHRMLDVSALKIAFVAWGGGEAPKTEVAHTPLKDIEGSIAELKHYLGRGLNPVVMP